MKKLIIIIIILIVIGGAVWYLSLKGKPAQEPEVVLPGGEITMPAETAKPLPTIDPIVKLKNDLTIQARVFIERYGSWSNQSNFENFEDLMPYMTEKLKTETQTFINQQLSTRQLGQPYHGITTNIVSLNLKNLIADEKAEFSASVQQRETKNGATTILYKTAELIFVREEGEWKVDYINL